MRKQNTKGGFIIPLVILVVAAVVIGGGVYTYSKQHAKDSVKNNDTLENTAQVSTTPSDNSAVATTDGQTGANVTAGASVSTEGTLKDLFALKTPQTCTITMTTGDYSGGTGKVYTAGGKMRSDYTATVSGKTYSTHIVVKDDISYTWIDGMNTGFKMAINKTTPPATTGASATTKSQAPDMNQKVKYSCSGWTEDATKFDLPKVEFTDLSATMKVNVKVPTTPAAQ